MLKYTSGLTELQKAVEAKTIKIALPLSVLFQMWSEEGLVVVGMLGNLCLIVLLDKQNQIIDNTLTGLPNALTVMAPNKDQEAEAEADRELFWCPERVCPLIHRIVVNYDQEMERDILWSNTPHGIFADYDSDKNPLCISLLDLMNLHANEALLALHPILAEQIKKETEAQKRGKKVKQKFPTPHSIEEAEAMQKAIESTHHALSVTRQIQQLVKDADKDDKDSKVLAEILEYLHQDFTMIGLQISGALQKSVIGAAYYAACHAEPAAEA